MADLTAGTLWELFKNGTTWLTNLKRASEARKAEPRKAVRQIITTKRETAVYVRKINETGKQDHAIEARLSTLWTELASALEDLKIHKLEKRSITTSHP